MACHNAAADSAMRERLDIGFVQAMRIAAIGVVVRIETPA
jgi:hypothetical protein